MQVMQAQADAEVAHLHGIGVARFQRALMDGLQHSVDSINASNLGIDGRSAIVNILTMQQIAQQHQSSSGEVRFHRGRIPYTVQLTATLFSPSCRGRTASSTAI